MSCLGRYLNQRQPVSDHSLNKISDNLMRVDDTLLLPSSHRLFRERNSSKGGVNVDGRWQTSYARKSGTIKTKPLFLYDVPVQNRPTSLIVLPNTDQTNPSSSESIKASVKEENQMKVIMAGYAAAQKNVSVFISSLPEGSGPQHNLSNASNETTTLNSTSRSSKGRQYTPPRCWGRVVSTPLPVAGTEVWSVRLTSLLKKVDQLLTIEGIESIFAVHWQND
jgi:hypothetical protein